jgi:hypothetical protein
LIGILAIMAYSDALIGMKSSIISRKLEMVC